MDEFVFNLQCGFHDILIEKVKKRVTLEQKLENLAVKPLVGNRHSR